MDMDDDKMIKEFLSAGGMGKDDGKAFTAGVMQRIPHLRPLWLTVVEMLAAIGAAVALFVCFDGWSFLCRLFVSAVQQISFLWHTGINPLILPALIILVVWYSIDRIKFNRTYETIS